MNENPDIERLRAEAQALRIWAQLRLPPEERRPTLAAADRLDATAAALEAQAEPTAQAEAIAHAKEAP